MVDLSRSLLLLRLFKFLLHFLSLWPGRGLCVQPLPRRILCLRTFHFTTGRESRRKRGVHHRKSGVASLRLPFSGDYIDCIVLAVVGRVHGLWVEQTFSQRFQIEVLQKVFEQEILLL